VTTTFTLYDGSCGRTETVRLPPCLASLVAVLEPDSATLELPSHLTLGQAIDANQLRIIVELITPPSVPRKLKTYRNGSTPGDWLEVDANGVRFDLPRHQRGLAAAAERDGVSLNAAVGAQLAADAARQPPGLDPRIQEAVNQAAERAVKKAAQEAAREVLDS
jgi:hypothetical protein